LAAGDTDDWVAYASNNMPNPAAAGLNIDYTAADKGVWDRSTGLKNVIKQQDDGITFVASEFPGQGLYVYEISERANTYTCENSTDLQEWMSYSTAKYRVEVWVMEDEDGELYIAAIGTLITADRDEWFVPGTPGSEGDIGQKIDPKPGTDPEEGEAWDLDGDFSQMVFTNKYLKNNGGNDPDPGDPDPDPDGPTPPPVTPPPPGDDDTVFWLKKKVAGAGADKLKIFAFTVKVTKPTITGVGPSTNNPLGSYTAYIMELNTSGVAVKVGTALTFASGTAQTVDLKHGQWLAFVNLEVGSQVEVQEAAYADYKANYVLSLNNDGDPLAGTFPALGSADFNHTLGFPPYNSSITPAYVGEPDNYAIFTNTFKPLTPTGIAADDLPYLILVGLAVLASVGYAVIRFRKKQVTAL
jgi:hypothetical protein